MLPDTIITNEFYELENFKFSTSKNHLIWPRDLVERHSIDEIRFFPALSNPEVLVPRPINFSGYLPHLFRLFVVAGVLKTRCVSTAPGA